MRKSRLKTEVVTTQNTQLVRDEGIKTNGIYLSTVVPLSYPPNYPLTQCIYSLEVLVSTGTTTKAF